MRIDDIDAYAAYSTEAVETHTNTQFVDTCRSSMTTYYDSILPTFHVPTTQQLQMKQELTEAGRELDREKMQVELLRAALDHEHEEEYSPCSADLTVMKTSNSFNESLLSGLNTDRFHEFTDSDEEDDKDSDDELDLQIQELSSEMQRIQSEVKRGGEDTF